MHGDDDTEKQAKPVRSDPPGLDNMKSTQKVDSEKSKTEV